MLHIVRSRATMAKKGVKLATLKTTALLDLHATPALRGVAREVEAAIEAIMADAAR